MCYFVYLKSLGPVKAFKRCCSVKGGGSGVVDSLFIVAPIVCVCVCACVRARVCAYACVCV